MKQLQQYTAKVQGSNQYWYQELCALLNQKGPPTFFWTVSSADTYWPELHNFMVHPPETQPTHQTHVQAVINNPHITDWYFSSKLSDWINHWLYKTLDAEWHWCRYEYQARCSTQCTWLCKTQEHFICVHSRGEGCCWMAGIQQTSRWHWCGQWQMADTGRASCQNCSVGVCWLTMNDSIPDETWRVPVPHPCILNVTDLEDTDYHDIVNTVRRHTRCSPAYCLCKKPGHLKWCRGPL